MISVLIPTRKRPENLKRKPLPHGAGKFKHGHNGKAGKSPTYQSWDGMMQRCLNTRNDSYHRYGGNGITVCERWKEFLNFLEDMGERPSGTSLDRFPNPKGHYAPGNCRWATTKEQSRNTKRNIWVEIDGVRMVLADWERKLGYRRNNLRYLYHLGRWPN